MNQIPPPPSITEPTKAVQNKKPPQSFSKLIGKISCRLGIHKETEFIYIDSHGNEDAICGCERCGCLLG